MFFCPWWNYQHMSSKSFCLPFLRIYQLLIILENDIRSNIAILKGSFFHFRHCIINRRLCLSHFCINKVIGMFDVISHHSGSDHWECLNPSHPIKCKRAIADSASVFSPSFRINWRANATKIDIWKNMLIIKMVILLSENVSKFRIHVEQLFFHLLVNVANNKVD